MYAIKAAATALTATRRPVTSTFSSSPTGKKTSATTRSQICASDSTVGALQTAFAANIKTIVFGLQTTQFNLPGAVLDAFANAGAGEATVPAVGPASIRRRSSISARASCPGAPT